MGWVANTLSAARSAFRSRGDRTTTPMAADIEEFDAANVTSSDELRGIISGGSGSASGEAVSPERAVRLSAVYSSVLTAVWPTAQLPLILFRRLPNGSREEDTTNPLFSLLKDQPNEWQTSLEWREIKQRDVELRGNAYSLKIFGTGQRVQELIRLHPDQMKVTQDEKTLRLAYEYTRPDGRRVPFKQEEIFHIRGMGDDGLVGQSPISLHRETIGDALAVQRHGSKFYASGAKPLGAIEQEAPMGEEAREAFKKDFEQTYTGSENAFRTLMLPHGLKYKEISVSPRDAQYIDARKFSVTDIARIFKVPPHMIGDLEKATFSNIEEQSLEFVTYSMLPRLTRWEQAIKRDLLRESSDNFAKFNVSALLRGDFQSRQEGLQIMRQNGVINANKWLELEDMNPREDAGGDEYIVGSNMRVQDGTSVPGPNGE